MAVSVTTAFSSPKAGLVILCNCPVELFAPLVISIAALSDVHVMTSPSVLPTGIFNVLFTSFAFCPFKTTSSVVSSISFFTASVLDSLCFGTLIPTTETSSE